MAVVNVVAGTDWVGRGDGGWGREILEAETLFQLGALRRDQPITAWKPTIIYFSGNSDALPGVARGIRVNKIAGKVKKFRRGGIVDDRDTCQ